LQIVVSNYLFRTVIGLYMATCLTALSVDNLHVLSCCLFMYHWSGNKDVTLPSVWSQTGLVLDATSCVWGFNTMRFSDVTFSVMKFRIMERKWCDISGCHSGISEDLFFLWCDVFLGRCYPMFRCIHVPLCSYLMSRRTIWLFEHWRWRHYDPLKHEGLFTERNFVISRKTWNSSSHVSENLWHYGRLSLVAVQIFFATDRSVCTCWQYIQLSCVFCGCVRLNPTEEPGDRGKAEVPQLYEHNFTQRAWMYASTHSKPSIW